MTHPYKNLPPKNYWKQAVGTRNFLEISDLWTPKYTITHDDKIITAGSCFAQHISRAMRDTGYNWVNYEPGPKYLLPDQLKHLNYGIYSFRTSNIYTIRALRQWIEWAFNDGSSIAERYWHSNDRYFDPYRPTIEPGGFESAEAVDASRRNTLRAIKAALLDANLFVFTLGLTESWRNRLTGQTYAICPGTAGGTFNEFEHEFVNDDYANIFQDAEWIIKHLQSVNPSLKILLTVSPVPLTATASHAHVLPATIYSKSVLRAVAGHLASSHPHIDYFPSYEIVSSFPYRGAFFESNMRNVATAGVDHVMKNFLRALTSPDAGEQLPEHNVVFQDDTSDIDAVICEEMFLEKT